MSTMTTEPTGIVFDIQHFSVSDGPGIRTVVFLKDCPLRCLWCHNPESYRARPQLMAYQEHCLACGACAAACHQHTGGMRLVKEQLDGCTSCGACVAACPSGALEMAGRTMTVSDVMDAVMEDAMFYQTSGGGLTLSGGEPMAQFDFSLALLKKAKTNGLHVCMETSGYCSETHLLAIQPYVDLFLYDYKLTGDEEHRKYTGVSQQQILDNLHALDKAGAAVTLRCPIIPGINMHVRHTDGIIRLANSLNGLRQIHLEPYHKIGLSKRTRLGMDDADTIEVPKRPQLADMAERIAAETHVETLVM